MHVTSPQRSSEFISLHQSLFSRQGQTSWRILINIPGRYSWHEKSLCSYPWDSNARSRYYVERLDNIRGHYETTSFMPNYGQNMNIGGEELDQHLQPYCSSTTTNRTSVSHRYPSSLGTTKIVILPSTCGPSASTRWCSEVTFSNVLEIDNSRWIK